MSSKRKLSSFQLLYFFLGEKIGVDRLDAVLSKIHYLVRQFNVFI
jgi:hypothetical protein